MYRVLIVEDDMLVRMGLKNLVNWDKFNMEVIKEAKNGQIALDIYEEYKPDVVITDIRMPVMDGMELITKIRQKDKLTRIIILTCVEEFDLARKAMSLGVSDYILKLTMNMEDIDLMLQKVKNELDQNKFIRLNHIAGKTEESASKDQLLKDFLLYNRFTQEQFDDCIKKYKIRLNPSHLVLCAMEINPNQMKQNQAGENKDGLVCLSTLSILTEVLEGMDTGEAFQESDEHYIMAFNIKESQYNNNLYEYIESVLKNISNLLSMYLGVGVTFGVSSIQNGFISLRKMYEQASSDLEQKVFLEINQLDILNQEIAEKRFYEMISTIRELPGLRKVLDQNEYTKYNQKIDEIISDTSKNQPKIKSFFCELIQFVTYNAYSLFSISLSDIASAYNVRIDKARTISEIIGIYKGFICKLIENITQKTLLSKEVSDAIQYINKNYPKNITLDEVANYVNLSSSYFSNVFKKETCVNFIEYLNNLRIEKARKLILSTHMKAYEISEKVGFTESTYFCKVFKRIIGISPYEYRKRWAEDRMEAQNDEEV